MKRAAIIVYDGHNPPPPVTLDCYDPSLTKQSETAAADINNIVKQYAVTGMLPQISSLPAAYLDNVTGSDYRANLHLVMQTQLAFDKLPATVRARFENDPAYFLDFISNPANIPEAQRLGLLAKPDTPPPAAAATIVPAP